MAPRKKLSASSAGLLNDKATEALVKLEGSHEYHDAKRENIKRQQEAYEGILKINSEAAQWESHLHPPLINHTIETAMSMLLDDDIRYKITPKPRFYKPGEFDTALEGAKAHEALFRHQMVNDRFDEFQRPFVLQAAINRVSIAKTHWREDIRTVKSLQAKPMIPGLGKLSPVRLKEVTKKEAFFDGPVTETVDLRDFYWHEAATSLDNARWCAHAIWMSLSDIQKLADQGYYDPAAVAHLKEAEGAQVELADIELEREKRGRRHGMIEVLELWDRDTMTLHTYGARRVLLAQGEWPFWHQEFPFVAMSLAPFPFSIQGLSLVEKLADMQEAFWDLLNQTRDNTKLINNAIVLMASDYDDQDSFEYAPGAVNTVDRPDQVVMWSPNVNIAQTAMPLMEKIQTDMNNLAMGQPITTPVSGRVTATEVATLSQIAQNAAAKMKAQVTFAYQRIGHQRMKLNQQFIRTPQYVDELGLDGAQQTTEILPQLLQADTRFDLAPSPDSAIRAEKRAEAQALFTMASQSEQVMIAVKTPWNMRAFGDKVLEAFGIENKDEFYLSPQAMPMPGGPQQQPEGAPEQGAGPGGEKVGVTAPQATAPTTSPSNQASLAPGIFAARALASQGGVNNTKA